MQVTDEARQMSELAGAKEKGEDKVKLCSFYISVVQYRTRGAFGQRGCPCVTI